MSTECYKDPCDHPLPIPLPLIPRFHHVNNLSQMLSLLNGTNSPATASASLHDSSHVTDVSVTESVSIIWSFIRSQYSITVARSLRGKEAQRFIDFIDRVRDQLRDCGASQYELNLTCRLPHCQNSMKSFENNVCTWSTRYAKTAKSCRPRIFYSRTLYTPTPSIAAAGSQTSAKESTWVAVWLSKTSDLERRTDQTGLSRY